MRLRLRLWLSGWLENTIRLLKRHISKLVSSGFIGGNLSRNWDSFSSFLRIRRVVIIIRLLRKILLSLRAIIIVRVLLITKSITLTVRSTANIFLLLLLLLLLRNLLRIVGVIKSRIGSLIRISKVLVRRLEYINLVHKFSQFIHKIFNSVEHLFRIRDWSMHLHLLELLLIALDSVFIIFI